ncbi:MAG: NADH-quinone oxidoreductase subunit H [Planctomycetes bacterium]|nr:NADH-quinone oxidoreductase subunit H [Planctomycetota bacterium]
MSDIAVWTLFLLVFPGMLFSVALGLCLCWVDRKVTALVQWRKGPPPMQPFWDVVKLLGKEVIAPAQAWLTGFLWLPFVGFAGAVLGAVLVWQALLGLGPQPAGDLIVVLYLLAMPGIAIVLGGSASGNPLAAVGASREMKLMLAYELPFVVALLVAAFQVRTLPDGETTRAATLSLQGIGMLQADHGSVLWRPSGLLAFAVALLCAHAKLGFVPFDVAEADTELAEGALLE